MMQLFKCCADAEKLPLHLRNYNMIHPVSIHMTQVLEYTVGRYCSRSKGYFGLEEGEGVVLAFALELVFHRVFYT